MKINGKEIRFKATLRAVLAISEICPDGDINRVHELFGKMDSHTLRASITTILALSNGYLTESELLDLDVLELQTALDEAMTAFRNDQKPTVEVKPKKDEATEAEEPTTTA